MSDTVTFNSLEQQFSEASSLPQLPGAALRLIQILENDDVNSAEVERIIIGDPALAAAVIRAASSALYGGEDCSTIRGAIMRLGHRAVQSVAVSLGVQALMGSGQNKSSFDRQRFARHSIFVGFLARYLYACRYQRESFKSRWSRDEVFAAGVLHDLGPGLLARVSPTEYDKVFNVARRGMLSFHTAFESVYGESVNRLAVMAAETWRLPALFVDVLRYCEHPSTNPEEFIALSCIDYSNYLAEEQNIGLFQWRVTPVMDEGVAEEVGLSEEDIPSVVTLVTRHTAAYVPSANAA